MRLLIIVGSCLRVNSSANLCHLSYIKGFVENGCEVTVLSMAECGQIIDDSVKLPEGAKYIEYAGSFLLKFINPESRKSLNRDMVNKKRSLNTIIFSKLRNFVLACYGPFGYSQSWLNKVKKHYKDHQKFDLIISLSSPVTSHLAAHLLLKKKAIQCKKFIQLWEDPWQYDLYKEEINARLLKLEYKITQYADEILYVSPITADFQKNVFPLCEMKIDWLPLPYYYKDDSICDFDEISFGYFGDYFPNVRNLLPFYNVAKEMELNVNICGSPDTLFQNTNSIHVLPRLPLYELKKFEEKTNVLVFVCNLKGGQIPGKIYQYSATKKKILFILDGTIEEAEIIKSYFEKFNRYHFCLNNEKDIKNKIGDINNLTRIDNSVVEFFSPKNITSLILGKYKTDKEVRT